MFAAIRKVHEQALFNAVKTASNVEAATTVVYGDPAAASPEDNATWVQAAMQRLEARFDPPTVRQIRMNCQCGYGMDEKLALVKELTKTATSMEEFANQDKARTAGLSCIAGDLYLEFPFCPCPILADVAKLDTLAWCQCTTGYSKVLFEQAFGCDVAVELLKSIKRGDEVCLMKIIPADSVWK